MAEFHNRPTADFQERQRSFRKPTSLASILFKGQYQVKMPSTLVATALSVVCLLGGYFYGFTRGKGEMDQFCGSAMGGLSAALRNESLSASVPVLDAKTPAEEQAARIALVRFVRIQAKLIQECVSDSKCSELAMKPMPKAAFLEHAKSIE